MIILIAPEKDITHEIEILHQLFQAGLQYFHLRKPDKNYEEYSAYLNKIDSRYHDRIVIHHFHELINSYNLKGIHFQEQKRIDHIDSPGKYFKDLNMYGKTISSSFHHPKDIINCYFEFDYHLLSPIFTSISKKSYNGRGFDVSNIDKTIIGMGGVTVSNLPKFTKLGFNGVGVLGGIWKSSTPILNFEIMNNYYKLT